MATLKDQIANVEFTGMERESAQEAIITDRKTAPNGCGFEFLLVDFTSTGHPYDAKGVNVVVIEDGYAYIDNYYKKMF